MGISHFSCSEPEQEEINAGPTFRLQKLYYENSRGEQGITTYYYDRGGFNYLAHWQLADSSRSSLNYHEIDTNGKLLRKERIFSDGISSDRNFEYDSVGQLFRQDFKRSDGVTGTTSYQYDDKGLLSMADCKGLNGWFHGQIHYHYEDGIKTGAMLMRDSDTIGSIQYVYDENRLEYESWDFNGQWDQTFQYEYARAVTQTFTYSNVHLLESPWFRVSEEYHDYNGQEGGPSYYKYDGDNRLESKEYIRSDGMRTSTIYEYDTTGLLRYSYMAYPDGDTALFHYWYNINRELLVRTWEHPDGTRGSETYRYDDNGFLYEGEYENMDGWMNGILRFDNDETGTLTRAVYKGNDGLDALLTFSYDHNFNLVKTHWEFSDGRTQSYSFRYDPPDQQ